MISTDQIIIVEGIHDIAFLKTFINAHFIKTDGTSIPTETINQIINLRDSGKEFIILTDPDYPGSFIRNKLLEVIPNAKIALINKKAVRKQGTIGVENATKEEILNSLDNLLEFREHESKISRQDLYELGLLGLENSSFLREKVGTVLFLGHCNAKQLLYRINCLNLSREEIIKKIKEIL